MRLESAASKSPATLGSHHDVPGCGFQTRGKSSLASKKRETPKKHLIEAELKRKSYDCMQLLT
jgi:hypothetical protein